MSFNPTKRNRKSTRLKGYDYSKSGLYFITICTKGHLCLFGKITDGYMILNDAGKAAQNCWFEIPQHFPNVELHQHMVMPNHVHGIIELIKDIKEETIPTGPNSVGANNYSPLPAPIYTVPFKSPSQTIGSIVRGYKTGVTKWFRNAMPNHFPIGCAIWQRNYHDHIIRNEASYVKISEYIFNNPVNWKQDKFYRG